MFFTLLWSANCGKFLWRVEYNQGLVLFSFTLPSASMHGVGNLQYLLNQSVASNQLQAISCANSARPPANLSPTDLKSSYGQRTLIKGLFVGQPQLYWQTFTSCAVNLSEINILLTFILITICFNLKQWYHHLPLKFIQNKNNASLFNPTSYCIIWHLFQEAILQLCT